MSSLEFEIDRLRKNAAQWDAFNHSGHCVVLAPPGSGKTSLLTTKLAAELVNARGPRGAVCITMTNEAAGELRRRLDSLGLAYHPNLFIGTVHSFALNKIIKTFAPFTDYAEVAQRRLATSAESVAIFEEAAYGLGYERRELKQARVTVDRARQRLDLSGHWELGGSRIAQLGESIQSLLAEKGLIDFLDLVRYAVEIVEANDWIGTALVAAFPRVFVDEYQDLPPGLDRLIRMWALPPDNDATLFAVGDPDQSIYEFSGAHPELLLALAESSAIRRVQLLTNYRSGQFIIDSASSALGLTYSVVGQREGGTVHVHHVPGGEDAQARAAADLVLSMLDRGQSAEQIAILSAWSQDRDAVVLALRNAGVPVFAREDTAWRTTPLTSAVELSASWVSQGADSGVDLPGLLSRYRAIMDGRGVHQALTTVVRALNVSDAAEPAFVFVRRLISESTQEYLFQRNADDLLEFKAFCEWLEAHPEMPTSELGERSRAPGCVMATTIHSAKGLEFDAVILVGADSAALDSFARSDEELAEPRRKFYVAITRARNQFEVIYTDSRTSAAGNAYTVRPSALLSRLLVTT